MMNTALDGHNQDMKLVVKGWRKVTALILIKNNKNSKGQNIAYWAL